MNSGDHFCDNPAFVSERSAKMPHPVSLSKSKLLSYLQCPRRLWLEQYSPELEEPSDEIECLLETGRAVGAAARDVYGAGSGIRIEQERGLRHALEQTTAVLSATPTVPIFEATFEHEGVLVQVDIFDDTGERARLIEVKSSTKVKDSHVDDCAIQAWTIESLGRELGEIALANINTSFVYSGDGDYGGLFAETDVTERARNRSTEVPVIVERARAILQELDEPEIDVGEHCTSNHRCPFFLHCMPAQGEFPVAGLGGKKAQIFEWLRAGIRDLRDVAENELSGDVQRRIWRQTRLGESYIGAQLRTTLAALAWPRFYLDFETISFAIPVWAGTQPYEALPFQWSCHVEHGSGERAELEHGEFLDLSGAAPMRQCAEALIDMVGTDGPIIVYTGYEKGVLDGLARRYSDLSESLAAIASRLIDLHPMLKAHYYHPDMHGSWSIKAVLPTISTDLDYASLGSVRDGMAAQSAFREALSPGIDASRHEQLRRDLLSYCRYDTLAMVKLVEHFLAAAPSGPE